MSVKAKFRCNAVTDYGTQMQAQMSAVYDNGTGENADFTSVTPYGELKINIQSDAPAANYFKPGGEYYLVFEKLDNAA